MLRIMIIEVTRCIQVNLGRSILRPPLAPASDDDAVHANYILLSTQHIIINTESYKRATFFE